MNLGVLVPLTLLIKIFVTHRTHNGTALLIYELMVLCGGSPAFGGWFQDSLRRRLNRRFGCYVSPRARLGKRCLFPHPVGIVIGDGVVIGDDCVIYQNVTLGAHGRAVYGERYPSLGNGVVVYAGAVVVGRVCIGDGAVVGANAVVTRDVSAGDVVAGVPAMVLGRRVAKCTNSEGGDA
ncbi:serine O-acetyltransferase [Methylosinus sp. PW1]|uniref:serine O-acetyltransferase n=1 Tax=Methylosinus sp. PW1 TaxID=107636 RepID=UPI0006923502|nr:hypothetical protein [Methylosinus sp. PW1]